MTMFFEVEKLLHEFNSEITCRTFDLEEAIEECKCIDGDYNLLVWVNDSLEDLYMDPTEDEIRKIVKVIMDEYQIKIL